MNGAAPRDPLGPRDFWVYGLRVRSDFDLPDWPASPSDTPDLIIQRASLPPTELEGPVYSARSELHEGELRVSVLGVGRYAATAGNLIRVDPEPDAKPEDLRLYLTGAMMGAILHQRGAYPLHASCVTLGSHGVAFAGRSGAGKSTLVAALVRHGATFVSDDICVVATAGEGVPRIWPGAARVKLDEPGLAAVAGEADGLDTAGGNRGKYHLPMAAPAPALSPVPLHAVYLLQDGEAPPRVERLTGLEAISALVDETYFLAYAHGLGLSSQVFRWTARLAHALRVSRLIRPRGLQHLPAIIKTIEQDLRDL